MIEVYGGFGAKPELIMAFESKLIKKGKLRHLLVSTGYQSSGDWIVTKVGFGRRNRALPMTEPVDMRMTGNF